MNFFFGSKTALNFVWVLNRNQNFRNINFKNTSKLRLVSCELLFWSWLLRASRVSSLWGSFFSSDYLLYDVFTDRGISNVVNICQSAWNLASQSLWSELAAKCWTTRRRRRRRIRYTTGVSNSNGLGGRMRFEARSRGPHWKSEKKHFEFPRKDRSTGKSRQNVLKLKKNIFIFSNVMFAGHLFETPDIQQMTIVPRHKDDRTTIS